MGGEGCRIGNPTSAAGPLTLCAWTPELCSVAGIMQRTDPATWFVTVTPGGSCRRPGWETVADDATWCT